MTKQTSVPSILYSDSDESSQTFVKEWLRTSVRGCSLTCANNGSEMLRVIENRHFDVFLFDYCLGDMTAPKLCQISRKTDTTSPIIICSPFDREIDRRTALDAGATDFIIKPSEFSRLATLIRGLQGIEGSRGKRRLFQRMRRAAAII